MISPNGPLMQGIDCMTLVSFYAKSIALPFLKEIRST